MRVVFLFSLLISSVAHGFGANVTGGVMGAYSDYCAEASSYWTPQYSSIVGYWKMNGKTGTNFVNGNTVPAIIGGATGTVANTPTAMNFQTGRLDQGVYFDGTGYLTYPNTAALKPAFPFTISAWIKPSAVPASGGYKAIIATDNWGVTSAYCGVQLGLDNPGGAGVGLDIEFGTGGYTMFSHQNDRKGYTFNGTISTGNWYHIVLVATNETTVALYVNNVAQALVSNGGGGSALGYCASGGTIGYQSGQTGTQFNGIIDELIMWNVALSATDVATLYNNQKCN